VEKEDNMKERHLLQKAKYHKIKNGENGERSRRR
jgi:hypothetical protein